MAPSRYGSTDAILYTCAIVKETWLKDPLHISALHAFLSLSSSLFIQVYMMPVFTEYSTFSRDLRVLPSFAPSVPRLIPKFEPIEGEEKYEVVIAGVSQQKPSGTRTLAEIP